MIHPKPNKQVQASRRFMLLAVMAAAAGSVAPLAHAQKAPWPSKTVKIIVPYPPGGAVDVATRKMAQKLSEQTGQSFIVENKPGATGTIGASFVAQAQPDVPTFQEAGVKWRGVVNWTGLWAPHGTPADVTQRLQKEVATAMASDDMKQFAQGTSADARQVGSEEFGRLLKDSTDAWGKVAANTAFEKQ